MTGVAVSERQMVEGLALHVVRPASPTRAPMLLLHGMFGGAWYFEHYQRFFASRGHATYALDLRGHGESRNVERLGRVSMRDYIADAMTAARSLDRPIVIGHSMGGLLAQALAEADAVRAAVLLCAAPPRWISPLTWRLLRRMLPHVPALLSGRTLTGTLDDHLDLTLNCIPEQDRPALAARFGPESGHAALELAIGAIAIDERRVRCPVLSVAATDDHFVVPRVGRALAKKYRAALQIYDRHGHFLVVEPQWEVAAQGIAGWLDSVDSNSRVGVGAASGSVESGV